LPADAFPQKNLEWSLATQRDAADAMFGDLYSAALQQRIEAYQRRAISLRCGNQALEFDRAGSRPTYRESPWADCGRLCSRKTTGPPQALPPKIYRSKRASKSSKTLNSGKDVQA
jgi:hypothetical protein